MGTRRNAEDCLLVSDHADRASPARRAAGDAQRGAALRQRRLDNGIRSVRALHERSGVSRDAITSAEAGRASEATYQRLEAWLSRYELANAVNDVALAQVEYEVQAPEGVRVVVRGLLADAEELERTVARLARELG